MQAISLKNWLRSGSNLAYVQTITDLEPRASVAERQPCFRLFTESAAMIEYHAYILGTDGKVISRHNLFNEVSSAVAEATALVGARDGELWQGAKKNVVVPRAASRCTSGRRN
jgi:hypothetical protein